MARKVIHSDDAPKAIGPVTSSLTVKKLVLDPGHGGNDSGARAQGVWEKEITLDIARELRTLLKRARYDVALTPTLAHPTPLVGHLDPTLDYDTVMERILQWVAFTPWQNAQFFANNFAPRSDAASSGAGPKPRKIAVLSARAGFCGEVCVAAEPLLLVTAVCAPNGNTLAAKNNAAGIENRRT